MVHVNASGKPLGLLTPFALSVTVPALATVVGLAAMLCADGAGALTATTVTDCPGAVVLFPSESETVRFTVNVPAVPGATNGTETELPLAFCTVTGVPEEGVNTYVSTLEAVDPAGGLKVAPALAVTVPPT